LTTLILNVLAIFACALFSLFHYFFKRFSPNKKLPKITNLGRCRRDRILRCTAAAVLTPRAPRPTLTPVDPCRWSACRNHIRQRHHSL